MINVNVALVMNNQWTSLYMLIYVRLYSYTTLIGVISVHDYFCTYDHQIYTDMIRYYLLLQLLTL